MHANTDDTLLQLLQVSLGSRNQLTNTPDENLWHNLWQTAQQQTITGILFQGIERLPPQQRPPRQLLLQWYAATEQIKTQNKRLNQRTIQAVQHFQQHGYQPRILKGQANAALYPDPNLRTPGDIDIWVPADRDQLAQHALNHNQHHLPPNTNVKQYTHIQQHHAQLALFPDVIVELHFIPIVSCSPLRQKAWQHLFRTVANQKNIPTIPIQGHTTPLPTLPPIENLLFQLMHILKHLVLGGIGLRQILDLHHLLRNTHLDTNQTQQLQHHLHTLGLTTIATALAYILQQITHTTTPHLPPPNPKTGQTLWRDILQSGNFGRYDPRLIHESPNKLLRYITRTHYALQKIAFSPTEALCSPLFRAQQYIWQHRKGYNP